MRVEGCTSREMPKISPFRGNGTLHGALLNAVPEGLGSSIWGLGFAVRALDLGFKVQGDIISFELLWDHERLGTSSSLVKLLE